MTNYSLDPAIVRVSYFRLRGKWYMDEELDMRTFYTHPLTPIDAVRAAILAQGERGASLLAQFVAVVLEPYHELAYPVMLVPE